MPPRPRPRPRPKLIGALSTNSVPLAATSTPPLPTVAASDDLKGAVTSEAFADDVKSSTAVHVTTKAYDDDDSYFDRSNRTRLKKMMERAAKTPEPQPDSGDETTPSSGKKRKRGMGFGKVPTLPNWTRTINGVRVASDIADVQVIDLSSDSERSQHSEDEGNDATPIQRKKRAITPPPALNAADLAYVKRVTRENLGGNAAHDSDSDNGRLSPASDELELLPELAAISAEARARSQSRALSTQPDDPTKPAQVMLMVRMWPLEEGGEQSLRPLKFKVKRHDPFRRAFQIISERSQIPLDDLIVTYDRKRVWGSGTPDALNIDDDIAELNAYHKTVHDRLMAARDAELFSGTPDPERAKSPNAEERESVEPTAETGAKLHLNIRSASNSLRLTVKSTTKLESLLRHFTKTFKEEFPSGVEGARLVLDGEVLDLDEDVGTLDLEDGDMLEVK